MRTLVTGGAGFIGSHLCDALVARGDEVCCVDNLYLGREANICHLAGNPRFRFRKVDILERPEFDEVFAAARPLPPDEDVVIRELSEEEDRLFLGAILDS